MYVSPNKFLYCLSPVPLLAACHPKPRCTRRTLRTPQKLSWARGTFIPFTPAPALPEWTMCKKERRLSVSILRFAFFILNTDIRFLEGLIETPFSLPSTQSLKVAGSFFSCFYFFISIAFFVFVNFENMIDAQYAYDVLKKFSFTMIVYSHKQCLILVSYLSFSCKFVCK